jgi:hypothetical protein
VTLGRRCAHGRAHNPGVHSPALIVGDAILGLVPLVDSLEDKPRGRGIDGIYENAYPPPAYIVTETKYRTGAGANTRYIDGDGTETTELLSTTKGSKAGHPAAKQMSDDWIKPRLIDELGARKAIQIEKGKYDRWLMIVDESGKVVSITKLDKSANAIGKMPL